MQSNFSEKANCRSEAYRAASGEQSLEFLRDFWREEGVAPIDNRGETILHFLAIHAARFGKKDMVEMILSKEKDLVFVRNNLGETPLYVAAASGEKEIFTFLANYDFTELTTKRNDGKTVLHVAVDHDFYGIPVLFEESKLSDNSSITQARTKVVPVERSLFINFLLGNSWLQAIDEAKQKHILALILAKMLLENFDWSYTHSVRNPLIQASQLKINELVVEILQIYPEAVEALDEEGRNILHIAVKHKNRFLFDYLVKTVAHKDRILADIDHKGNTILHYAATVGSPFRTSTAEHEEEIWCILSVFMMMWGVLWFKRVKSHVHPRLWDVKNSNGVTAEELFEENHLHIRKEAEDAIRNLANSALVLATLLCTVNFAAIFTLPGGFDQKTGLPMFLNKLKFELKMMIFYLCAAILSSAVTIGTLLSFILCKFDTDDFYISLPTRVVNAMVSVFYATTFSVLACVQTLNLDNIFWNKDVWWLIIAMVTVGFIMTLIYIDLAFPIFDYLYYLVSYSFTSPKRRHM